MQNRRQFLCTALHTAAGATVTLVLTPILGGCGSNDNNGVPVVTTNPTTPACDGAGATSTNTLGHTHTVCVPLADLNNPPAAGNTYTTSPAATDGHVHQVILSAAQLVDLAKGGTITVTTTIVESHTHDFTLLENPAPQTSPVPTTVPTPVPPVTGPY